MDKKLLLTLSLMAMPAIAMEHMEMTKEEQLVIPSDTNEEKVVITIQDQEREIPKRYIPLIGTLADLTNTADLPTSADFYKEGTSLPVSLATWQLIEPQLERVYKNSLGDTQSRDEIFAEYNQLDSTMLIGLIGAVEYLDIPLLKEITLELAQDKLTVDEVLTLSADMRNEVIKRKAFKIAGPVTLKELAVCRGHEEVVGGVCVTPDGKMIVSGSDDTTVRIWDMDGNQLAVCRGHDGWAFSVCVTSDNKIVSGSGDNTVRIWDMNGKELAVCFGHEEAVWCVCVTSDNRIVSGSKDNTVRIWDMNGNQLAVCRGHGGPVRSVCVTSDNRIVSGSEDKTVRIWDMKGTQLAVCRGHECQVWSVCMTPDNMIVSGSTDKTVRIWNMSGISLNNRLSSMSEKQAKLIDRVLKRTKSLLFELKAGLSETQDSLREIIPDDDDDLERGIQGITTKACGVVSKQCWQEIEEILEEEELEEAILEQPKKRKELENGESNPAKKVRLPQELITENKEQNHE